MECLNITKDVCTPPISEESITNNKNPTNAFSRTVEKTDCNSSVYVHIELGAGNFRHEEGKIAYLSTQKSKKIHERSCLCAGCNYDHNRPRYRILEETIDHIIKTTQSKKVEIHLNDIDVVSLDQAVKHAREHIKRNYKKTALSVEVKSLAGNLFELDIKSLQPSSVHLKNPDLKIFSRLEENPDDFVTLISQCQTCESGGLIVTCAERSITKVLPLLCIQGGLQIEEYDLPFDVSYQRTNNPEATSTWKERVAKFNFTLSNRT